jgi:O-antigen/teichoic acid export membrane protein
MRRISPTSWVTAQNLFKQLFTIALFAIQAPLLGPKAFGLIALVMVFVGFCEYVLEITGTDALISIRDIEPQHYSTMTTMNVVAAAVMGVGIFVFAPSIGALFREPQLADILHVMSALPMLTVLSSAPNAACRRELDFQPLVTRLLASTVAGGVVGLVLTFMDYGVWALVWQAIVQRVLNVAILWKLVKMPFQMGFSQRHFQDLKRFGTPMLVSQGMSWGADQIPRYILGLYLGASELGLFSLAGRLSDTVLQLAVSPRYAVARIEMRRFADNREGIETFTRGVLTHISVLTFPLCLGAAAVMPLLFTTWLNARWAGGVIPAQLMMLGILPYITHYTLSAALMGTNNQSKIAFNATVQTITLVLVSLVFAPMGLIIATAAIACRPLLTASIPVYFARKYCGLGVRLAILGQIRPFSAAAVMAAVVYGLEVALRGHMSDGALLVSLVGVGALTYVTLISVLLPNVVKPVLARLRR